MSKHQTDLPKCPICFAPATQWARADICQFFQVRCRIPEATEITSNYCADCEHVFFYPQPTEEQLARYYGGYHDWFYHQERQAFEPSWAANHAAYDDRASPHWALRDQVYRTAFPSAANFTGNIVDFGGGDGSLARSIFPHATVTPMDMDFKGDADALLATCDLLFAAHVFEHLPQPTAILSGLVARLRRGAEVWVEVPEQYSGSMRETWDGIRRGENPGSPLLFMHEHIQHFSVRSLDVLLAKTGVALDERVRLPGSIIGALGRAGKPAHASLLDRMVAKGRAVLSSSTPS